MMAFNKIRNRNNPQFYADILPKEKQVLLARTGASTFSRQDKFVLKKSLSPGDFDKIERDRYQWLFDEFQKFDSLDIDEVNNKSDLEDFVENTFGKSKAWQSMKEGNPRKYQASLDSAVNSFWKYVKGGGREKAEKVRAKPERIVKKIQLEEAQDFVKQIKAERSQRKALADARFGKLFRVREKTLVAKRVDKRGRVYHINLLNGQRTVSPEKLLKEAGL